MCAFRSFHIHSQNIRRKLLLASCREQAVAVVHLTMATAATGFSLLSLLHSSPAPKSPTLLPIKPLQSSKITLQPNKISFSKLFASSSSSSSSWFSKTPADDFFTSVVDSVLVLAASLAISLTVLGSDVGPASAFVVTTPRKLQTDELATVRLFQENTPSVVYITNLAVR